MLLDLEIEISKKVIIVSKSLRIQILFSEHMMHMNYWYEICVFFKKNTVKCQLLIVSTTIFCWKNAKKIDEMTFYVKILTTLVMLLVS